MPRASLLSTTTRSEGTIRIGKLGKRTLQKYREVYGCEAPSECWTQAGSKETIDFESKKRMREGINEAETVALKVVDQRGFQVELKIRKTTPLRKLMDAYCAVAGADLWDYRFFFQGVRVSFHHTSEHLGLEDGCVIDAMNENRGC